MIWFATLALSATGLAALAVSMHRHATQVFSSRPSRPVLNGLKAIGTAFLLAAAVLSISDTGVGYGLIMFLALATAAGVGIVLLLTYAPRSVGLTGAAGLLIGFGLFLGSLG